MDWIAQQSQIEDTLAQYQNTLDVPIAACPRQVEKLVTYIHTHLFDYDLSVSAAKQACGIRNNNISIRFKRTIGVGAREYVTLKRVEAAQLLLRQDHNISSIANALGYEHLESFTRVFVRIYGRCPSKYRLELSR